MLNLDLKHLPQTAIELIHLIGLANALTLIEKYGGRPLIFSKGLRIDGRNTFEDIAKIIGEPNAYKLADHYAGTPVNIPKCTASLRAVRNNRWRARFDEQTRRGISARTAVSEIAREPGAISHRKIWDILKQMDEPVMPEWGQGQGRLF
ncbi:MAG: Mor transcription activator family protein [Sulfuricellaceae bacterium]